MTLDPEDLFRLNQIDIRIIRHEPIDPTDLAWLVKSIHGLHGEFGERDEANEVEQRRVEQAEERLEEELQKVAALTTECAKLAAEYEALSTENEELRLSAQAMSPTRLKFLRATLAACLASLDRTVPDKTMLTQGDIDATLLKPKRTKPETKVRKKT